MPLSLGAQHKERRRHVVCLELVQHPKRDGWIRTVVKRQMHSDASVAHRVPGHHHCKTGWSQRGMWAGQTAPDFGPFIVHEGRPPGINFAAWTTIFGR